MNKDTAPGPCDALIGQDSASGPGVPYELLTAFLVQLRKRVLRDFFNFFLKLLLEFV